MHRVLLTLAALFVASTAWADVNVSGSGSVSVKPDTAVVSLGVITENKEASTALTANSAAMKKLFATLEDNKIGKDCIHTDQFNISPKYVSVKDKEGNLTDKLVGYVVTNNVTIKSKDLDNVGKLLDLLVKDGANHVRSVSFTVSKQDDFLDDARTAAMKQARKRAQLYADAGGFKLGRVISVSENTNVSRPRYYAAEAARAPSGDVPLAAGEQSFSVSVSVVFEIEGNADLKKKAK